LLSKKFQYQRLTTVCRRRREILTDFFDFFSMRVFLAAGNKIALTVNIKDVFGSFALWRDNSMSEKLAIKHTFRSNWLFEVEPFSRSSAVTLQELHDNVRLKKHLKRAVASEMAPYSLIQSIREGIRK
jgi:hypothetical protein